MDPTTTEIPARSRRQAMDFSLVLLSQGIESTIRHFEETGWKLVVAQADYEDAVEAIRKYRLENRPWPWRREIRRKLLFAWGSLAWVFLLGLFFWLQGRNQGIEHAGLMDSIAVSHGQWWRLFTAMFLHANLGHLAENASIGLVLLGLVMGSYGTGVGLLAALLAGAGGNVLTWFVYENHLSLGASGMVMGCLGLLAAQSIPMVRERRPGMWKYALAGVAAGLMLFTLLGTSPGSDVVAHLGGFVTGLLEGILLTLIPHTTSRSSVNLFAGALFCVIVVVSWWFALSGISRTSKSKVLPSIATETRRADLSECGSPGGLLCAGLRAILWSGNTVKNIREIKTGELVWVQPHAMKREFELRSGEEVLGSLRWNSSFGSLADAVAVDGKWTFKRTGFFSPKITVRAFKSESNLAVFTPNWKAEGTLDFVGGQSFRWAGFGFWRSQWAFTKVNGEHLVDFVPHASFLKKSAEVKVTPEGLLLTEASLLVLIGWYLMLLRSDDDEAATAVICAPT